MCTHPLTRTLTQRKSRLRNESMVRMNSFICPKYFPQPFQIFALENLTVLQIALPTQNSFLGV